MKQALLLVALVATLFGVSSTVSATDLPDTTPVVAHVLTGDALAVDEGEGGGSETIRCLYHYSYQAGNYDVHIYDYFYTRSGVWGGECRREYTMHEYNT